MANRRSGSKKKSKRGNYNVKGEHSITCGYGDWNHNTRMTLKKNFWKEFYNAYVAMG